MPVPLRTDFNAAALRTIARQTKDGPQARRLLALAAIYEGASRTEAARIGGVTVQIVRDWVMKFNALGPEGLVGHLVRSSVLCGPVSGREVDHVATTNESVARLECGGADGVDAVEPVAAYAGGSGCAGGGVAGG